MEILNKINEATDRVTAIEAEMRQLETEASDHEAAARAARAKRLALKQERESLGTVLRHTQTVHAAQLAASAAEKSRADADAAFTRAKAHEADVEKMKAELAEMIAKAKEAK